MLQTGTPDKEIVQPLPAVTVVSMQYLKDGCKGCGLNFDNSKVSISNRNPHNRILCFGCKKLFSLATRDEVYKRFQGPEKIDDGANIEHETRLLSAYYLHWSPFHNVGRKPGDADLYHLPLSPNFYTKTVNEKGEIEFIYQLSATDKHTAVYYDFCGGCNNFVRTKRRTLKKANQKAKAGGQVASYEELIMFLVDSNSTCVFTGVKGAWSSFENSPLFLLSLDHKVSLHAGGSSEIDNLQVTLQCLNNVKGNYDSEDFMRWVEAIKDYKCDH